MEATSGGAAPRDAYHALLSDAAAAESVGWLEERLDRPELRFGARPVCSVLRPRFLATEEYRELRRASARVLGALERAADAAMSLGTIRARFGLDEREEGLLADAPRHGAASPLSRLDGFFPPGGGPVRFVEYNAETPAGAGYGDALADIFLTMPVMRAFLRRFDVRAIPGRHAVLRALLAAHRARASGDAPVVCIVDWRDVPTTGEFVLFEDYFRSMGLECVIADPADMEYHGGVLRAHGLPVNVVYKRVLLTELLERCGLAHPVVRAVRDGAVAMVNPFRCKLLHKKASLAVLGDERNEALFDAAQRAAIAAHVPWTRLVEERHTLRDGARVDLVPHILANRERLVLKPNDDYGGHGILLGWDSSEAEWADGVRRALESPYVVQERVEIPSEPFPVVRDGTIAYEERIVDAAPFVIDGAYADGCLSRISTAALVNVTAGGGSAVPTFIVEAR